MLSDNSDKTMRNENNGSAHEITDRKRHPLI